MTTTVSAALKVETEATPVPVDHALIYMMVMISAADAQMSDNEMSLIGDLVRHLPVFRGFDINNLPDVARECTAYLSARKRDAPHAAPDCRKSVPSRLRETAYAIACDIAAADGSVSTEEARLLELLRGELSIDRLHAAAIERGARARYLRG